MAVDQADAGAPGASLRGHRLRSGLGHDGRRSADDQQIRPGDLNRMKPPGLSSERALCDSRAQITSFSRGTLSRARVRCENGVIYGCSARGVGRASRGVLDSAHDRDCAPDEAGASAGGRTRAMRLSWHPPTSKTTTDGASCCTSRRPPPDRAWRPATGARRAAADARRLGALRVRRQALQGRNGAAQHRDVTVARRQAQLRRADVTRQPFGVRRRNDAVASAV